jgi:hypothetical protein
LVVPFKKFTFHRKWVSVSFAHRTDDIKPEVKEWQLMIKVPENAGSIGGHYFLKSAAT